MNELLTWIARNPSQAFGLGVFSLILAGIIGSTLNTFVLNALRAFTGKYPPPRPVVQCDGNCKRDEVCRCCEDGCDEDKCECQNL